MYTPTQACHKLDVVHRDIKLENLMLTGNNAGGGDVSKSIKLVDFGLAAFMPKPSRSNVVGTPTYVLYLMRE